MVFCIGGIGHCLQSNVFLGLFLGGMHDDLYSSIFTKFLGEIHSHHFYSKTFPTFFLNGIGSGFYSNTFLSFFFLVGIGNCFHASFFLFSMFILISNQLRT